MEQLKVGRFITKKRKEQNLTQEQLAERLGISNKTISKWETGKCMPDYAVVKNLCEELNVSVSELMDGEETDDKSIRMYDEEAEKNTGTGKAKSHAVRRCSYRHGRCFSVLVAYLGRLRCQRFFLRASAGAVCRRNAGRYCRDM